MALNVVLLPDYLERDKIDKIKKKYEERNKHDNIDYHVSTYSEGTLVRSFRDSKELYDINEFVCVAYKNEIEKAGRAVKWLKCGLDENKIKIIGLEGDKEKDDSKLEELLK